MLPSLANLSLSSTAESASQTASTGGLIANETPMSHFVIQYTERASPAKTHPKGRRTLTYRAVKCTYCSTEIDVCANNFDSLLAGRVRAHLEVCPEFHWHVPPLRRSRVQACKPCGHEKSMNQLVLGAQGKLVRHELGSLIKCVAKSRRAADQRTLATPLTKDYWGGRETVTSMCT